LTAFVETFDGAALPQAVILFLYITPQLKKCQTAADNFCCFFVQKTEERTMGKAREPTKRNRNTEKLQKGTEKA
jgi:hypothetical protein